MDRKAVFVLWLVLMVCFISYSKAEQTVTDETDQGTELGAHFEAGGVFFNYP
jgi:hypothetical protein